MSYKKTEKGFTLIELLLVIAIVTLLSSIFTFSSTQAKEKAQDAKMASESHQVELALNMYKDKNGFMPSDLNVTSGKLYTEDTPQYKSNLQPLVEEGFIASIPKSPDGKSYAYGVSTDRKQALFASTLKGTAPRNSSSNSSNSCSFVSSGSLPTNCTYYFNYWDDPLCAYGFNNPCGLYVADNPDKICIPGSASDFCTIYNQDGDFASICSTTECGWGGCGPYGGSTSQGMGCPAATICDAPTGEGAICDGSNPNDICSCVE